MELDRKVREFPIPEHAASIASAVASPMPSVPTDDLPISQSMSRFVLAHAREVSTSRRFRALDQQSHVVVLRTQSCSISIAASLPRPSSKILSIRSRANMRPRFWSRTGPRRRSCGRSAHSMRFVRNCVRGSGPFGRLDFRRRCGMSSCCVVRRLLTVLGQIVFGTIVTRGPRSPLASNAIKELDAACVLFTKAAVLSRRAAKALVSATASEHLGVALLTPLAAHLDEIERKGAQCAGQRPEREDAWPAGTTVVGQGRGGRRAGHLCGTNAVRVHATSARVGARIRRRWGTPFWVPIAA